VKLRSLHGSWILTSLSSISVSWSQALQINLEYNTDILCQNTNNGLPVTAKESRRRLAGDLLSEVAFIAWKLDFDISFIHQRQLVYSAANLPDDLDTKTLSPNMGIMAYFIRHISIRKRVLRYSLSVRQGTC
jgi:hypothetical protein